MLVILSEYMKIQKQAWIWRSDARAAVYELFMTIGTKTICQISLISKYFLVKSQGLYDI